MTTKAAIWAPKPVDLEPIKAWKSAPDLFLFREPRVGIGWRGQVGLIDLRDYLPFPLVFAPKSAEEGFAQATERSEGGTSAENWPSRCISQCRVLLLYEKTEETRFVKCRRSGFEE